MSCNYQTVCQAGDERGEEASPDGAASPSPAASPNALPQGDVDDAADAASAAADSAAAAAAAASNGDGAGAAAAAAASGSSAAGSGESTNVEQSANPNQNNGSGGSDGFFQSIIDFLFGSSLRSSRARRRRVHLNPPPSLLVVIPRREVTIQKDLEPVGISYLACVWRAHSSVRMAGMVNRADRTESGAR